MARPSAGGPRGGAAGRSRRRRVQEVPERTAKSNREREQPGARIQKTGQDRLALPGGDQEKSSDGSVAATTGHGRQPGQTGAEQEHGAGFRDGNSSTTTNNIVSTPFRIGHKKTTI